MRTYRLIIPIILISACKTVQTTSVSSNSYSEDLSVHRPSLVISEEKKPQRVEEGTKEEAYVPLSGHLKYELDSIAKISYQQNKEGKYVEGFVIQVYSGSSRQTASDKQVEMMELFPELNAKMSYRQPNFRVKGGKYTDRLEASRVYNEVKEKFPRALLVPERLFISYE